MAQKYYATGDILNNGSIIHRGDEIALAAMPFADGDKRARLSRSQITHLLNDGHVVLLDEADTIGLAALKAPRAGK